MANKFGELSVVSNAFAPDVFADDAMTFELINGSVRITFGVVKMEEPAAPSANQMVAIGRLILPLQSSQRLALGLYDYLKKQGHDPAALIASAEDEQRH